jgi:hypothetical protein
MSLNSYIMEEENKEPELDKYTLSKMEKELKEIEEEKVLKIKWRKEIDQSKSFQKRLNKYNESSRKSFVTAYINQKYYWYRYGDFLINEAEKERSRWIDKAHKHLGCILQKQLFDLQCMWRAEEVKLEGIEKCYDFETWGEDIFNCPFLEPITKHEVKMYQDFLMKNELDFTYDPTSDDWQSYDRLKGTYNRDGDECTIPDWYEHHYTHTGTTRLLQLPDIRGEKEMFYKRIWGKKCRKKHKKN